MGLGVFLMGGMGVVGVVGVVDVVVALSGRRVVGL